MFKNEIRVLVIILIVLTKTGFSQSPVLNVPFLVKENAGVGINSYPVSFVLPLPKSSHFIPENITVSGKPTQIEVLERWKSDNSLKNVLVHFQADAGNNGNVPFTITEGTHLLPEKRVTVTDSGEVIILNTGVLRAEIKKNGFTILNQVWFDINENSVYEENEKYFSDDSLMGGIFYPRAGAGNTQFDSDRQDINFTIEEVGPLRAVIRAEAYSKFFSTTNHLHGFCVRIYAYAGKPYIKIDYQLQNGDFLKVRSWPLYFEGMKINFKLNPAAQRKIKFGLGNNSVFELTNSNVYLAQEIHNRFKIYNSVNNNQLYDSGILPNREGSDGFIDISDSAKGIMAVIRNFWQTWPNGLEYKNNNLSVQLFPEWSCQYYMNSFSQSGFYWIDDMQSVVKEVLLYFHNSVQSNSELIKLARTFQFNPVAVLPNSWYRTSKSTLGLSGMIPPENTIPTANDLRKPTYSVAGYDPADWFNQNGPYYGAGWSIFGDPEPGYRRVSCVTGGWPYSNGYFISTGNPADYFTAEYLGIGEINIRTQQMPGFEFQSHNSLLKLTENPYCGGRWRVFDGHGISKLAAPVLPNTSNTDETPYYYSRDDQHGWFYHAAEAYWLTGNYWLRDWYKFVSEFRKTRLLRTEPFPDLSSRATGHSLNHAIQSLRISGNEEVYSLLKGYLHNYLIPEQDRYYGDQRIDVEQSGGGFQTGYLMRAVIDLMDEAKSRNDFQTAAECFNYLSGLMEWNYNYGNFSYYFNARNGGSAISDGTGFVLVDPQSWYYDNTGLSKYKSQINTYFSTGINGGGQPYGDFSSWKGQFESRYYLHVKNSIREDTIPPAKITDLSAGINQNSLQLGWTAPTGSEGGSYHAVWSLKPISGIHSLDTTKCNWWAANAIGVAISPNPGNYQTVTFTLPDSLVNTPVYCAIFSFDSCKNVSEISNMALSGFIPVELSEFKYLESGDGITLLWTTITENNNMGFEIEVSDDKEHWQALDFINGKGTTVSETDYSYKVKYQTSKEYLWFRLKQIEYNGSLSYSQIVEVKVNKHIPDYYLSSNYPNPFNPTSKICYRLKSDGYVKLIVYNINGESMSILVDENKNAGYYEVELNAKSWSSGTYYYKIEVKNDKGRIVFADVKKMIILK